MSERTKLLKKAVLTSVGATINVERIKSAVREAMDDLVKVGQDLLEDLEEKGKIKADSVQDFLNNLRSETGKRTGELETKVQSSLKKAVREIGLVTKEDLEDIHERLLALEGDEENGEGHEAKKPRRKKQATH